MKKKNDKNVFSRDPSFLTLFFNLNYLSFKFKNIV